MHVEIRPVERLRGDGAIDLSGPLSSVIDALCRSNVDLATLRVVCDWIQYRHNFREPVVARPVIGDGLEVAVDIRRAGEVDLGLATAAALRGSDGERVHLEDWTVQKESCIWQFNQLYWSALAQWEQATGKEYEQALPGRRSDAHNLESVHERILDLFTVWDDLSGRNALPDELYVLELGVGNGTHARLWLDEFVRLDKQNGREYFRRLHYLMCDYSRHVLERAERAVADHAPHVSSLVLDATRPASALGFLRYKTFLVYISNVYDNLPTDELARIGGHTYLVEVRANLPAPLARSIGERGGLPPDQLVPLVHKLLRLGPEVLSEAFPQVFPTVGDAVAFWVDVWFALRLEERFVPLDGLDLYEVAPLLSGEHVRPLLEADGDVRMHVSNGAVASFAETIDLLHPYGRLMCHDLFVTDVHRYHTGFHGPGKYDGSIVNWVNGPLLQHVGRRRGLEVTLAPFGHRAGSNISTMTAQVRD